MMLSREIREAFLNYYVRHGHQRMASASLVPHNDPSLMFTNAGMVPFKNVFAGLEPRPCPCATTAQKCVRAGGKHNDLDNVGHTARHHTFFEMLGNFSFGDYFKERAIELAWNFLVQELQLPKDKLLVTVYHTDDEAHDLWRKIAGLTEDRIIRINSKDNFWMMGDTGPCGPCTEIFYDHGEQVFGGVPGSPDEDGDRYTEIWNLVFTQYDQVDAQTRVDLPHPCIDTGMGLERITAVMQGKQDNFETDILQGMIIDSRDLLQDHQLDQHVAIYKILVDHLRSSAFLIADGVLPSNEGRGYVLRRILRRAMRHAYQVQEDLHAKDRDLVMYRLLPFLVSRMGEDYPELQQHYHLIEQTLQLEEQKFRDTLGTGLKILAETLEQQPQLQQLDAATAFKLYDTYGFPLDLTQDILREKHITVDVAGFDAAMEQQRERAKQAWKGSGDAKTAAIYFRLLEQVGETTFLGYEQTSCTTTITAIVNEQGVSVEQAVAGEQVKLLCAQTVFYGESGGQVGDQGSLMLQGKLAARIVDTHKPLPHLFVHVAMLENPLAVGDSVELQIDMERRQRIQANHTATHLLHAALRQFLGDTATQRGSLVSDSYLRFDVAYHQGISREILEQIVLTVNRQVMQSIPVTTQLMPKEAAIASGACAFFGDKYEDQVRVLEVAGISKELCGGTHVHNTASIGLFQIVSEGAIASGVRRIEAVTGIAALQLVQRREAILEQLTTSLKVKPEELPQKIQDLLNKVCDLNKQMEQLTLQSLSLSSFAKQVLTTGTQVYSRLLTEGLAANTLRTAVLKAQQEAGDSSVVILLAQQQGKVSVICSVGKTLAVQYPATTLLQQAISTIGGKGGGGTATLAMGGGTNWQGAAEFVKAIVQLLS